MEHGILSKGLGDNTEFSDYHPLVNMMYFVLVIGITMFSLSPYFLVITFVFSWIYSVLLRGKKAVKMNLMMSVLMLGVMILMNVFFNNNGETVLLYINTNRITAESIVYGAASGVMLISVIIWFSCFNVIITADKLIYLFGKAAPVLGLTLSMIFRFIPLLQSRFAEISLGQKCMGRSHSKGNFIARARQVVKEISILIAWSLEASIESGDSMEARGYGLRGRTSFHLYKLSGRDIKAMVVMAAAAIPVIAAMAMRLTVMAYYPRLVFPEMETLTVVAIIGYAVLMATPIIIDIAGEYRWKQLDLNM